MIWIIVAVLIVLVLASYAGFLWFQVIRNNKKTRIELELAQKEQAQAELKHQNYLQTSLHVIAQSALNDELNISEGCIRVKVLLDNLDFEALDIEGLDKNDFSLIDEVYVQLQDFDTHQARKELSDKERKDQDRKRRLIEFKNDEMLRKIFTTLTQKFKIIPE